MRSPMYSSLSLAVLSFGCRCDLTANHAEKESSAVCPLDVTRLRHMPKVSEGNDILLPANNYAIASVGLFLLNLGPKIRKSRDFRVAEAGGRSKYEAP